MVTLGLMDVSRLHPYKAPPLSVAQQRVLIDDGLVSLSWKTSQGKLKPVGLDAEFRIASPGARACRLASSRRDSEVETWRRTCVDGQKLHEAVEALDHLVQAGSFVDSTLLYPVLKRCTEEQDLALGRRVHALTVRSGNGSDSFLANHLLRMYAAHARLEEAMQVFADMAAPNTFVWASIIKTYSDHGQPAQAIELFRRMRQSGVKPNDYVYVAVLKACACAEDFVAGKEVHADIRRSGEQTSMFVSTCLVKMYAQCGRLEDARTVFDKMPTKDVVAWTTMIAGYAHGRLGQEALNLYAAMQLVGLSPANQLTFVALLKACAIIGDIHQGKQLHLVIQKRGLETDIVVGNSLVDMYAKCGSLEDARKLFNSMLRRDVVTWNTMITGYAQHGLGQDALDLYADRKQECIDVANQFTYSSLLNACASVRALPQGEELHSLIQERGLEPDLVVGNCLVDMYAKCGSLDNARRVFDKLTTRDVVTWNTMIGGYTRHGLSQEALDLYARMQEEGLTEGNDVTFSCLLKACASIGALHKGKQIHMLVQQRELEVDLVMGNCLIDMYSKCGSLEDARLLFHSLPTKDVVTWTSMITGYAHHGLSHEALSLYEDMQGEGITLANHVTFVSLLKACASVGALHQGKQLHTLIRERGLEADLAVGNCLVDMYSKCGAIKDARLMFDKMPTRDVVTWTSMIGGYATHGLGQEALDLYAIMQQEGLNEPNRVTFLCLLKACTMVGAAHQGKQIHGVIRERGLEADAAINSCLVDMYAKCGSLESARSLFDSLPARDVVTWNALLNGYAEHGDGRKAILCFEEMEQQPVKPNAATFISLLVACSHNGLVSEGQAYFQQMVEDHGLVPTDCHHNCMVDLLGRSGNLDEAEVLLQTTRFENEVVGWTSLLSSCKCHGDVGRAQRCFNRLVALEPENASPYMLLGNVYAKSGRWEDVEHLEGLRKAAGAWKKPAKACIEVKNKVHEFIVGEERADISSKLESLNVRVKNEGGHVPQKDLVLKAVSDCEKEDALCGHAEKLALAYGLLNTSDGTSLLVTKNLRMCNDCHSSSKILSHLENREIIVRDAHRVHHFLNGSCSCGDRP